MNRLVSFGAGTQSTTLLLKGLDGDFGDAPDGAIFADTGDEPQEVYEWLERIERLVAPFPIYRVSCGLLMEDYRARKRRAAIPCFSTAHDGKPIMMSRFCSRTYKVEPIMRKSREIVGPKGQCETWIGISTDEAHRAFKPTGKKWITNRYPLIEASMSREACVNYVLRVVGARPPKSACKKCPFHGDGQWLDQKINHPDEFEESCLYDESIRDLDGDNWDRPRFLHRSLQPLRQVVFRHEGQLLLLDGFGNECDGVCGL